MQIIISNSENPQVKKPPQDFESASGNGEKSSNTKTQDAYMANNEMQKRT